MSTFVQNTRSQRTGFCRLGHIQTRKQNPSRICGSSYFNPGHFALWSRTQAICVTSSKSISTPVCSWRVLSRGCNGLLCVAAVTEVAISVSSLIRPLMKLWRIQGQEAEIKKKIESLSRSNKSHAQGVLQLLFFSLPLFKINEIHSIYFKAFISWVLHDILSPVLPNYDIWQKDTSRSILSKGSFNPAKSFQAKLWLLVSNLY